MDGARVKPESASQEFLSRNLVPVDVMPVYSEMGLQGEALEEAYDIRAASHTAARHHRLDMGASVAV